MGSELLSPQTYAAMQTGKPVSTYRKTILGMKSVKLLNPFTRNPDYVLLKGDPKKDKNAYISFWSDSDDSFFRNSNASSFKDGSLIAVTEAEAEKVKDAEIKSYSDEELLTMLKQQYFAVEKFLKNMESEAVLYRVLVLAEENGISEKYVAKIKAKLSEVQGQGITG